MQNAVGAAGQYAFGQAGREVLPCHAPEPLGVSRGAFD